MIVDKLGNMFEDRRKKNEKVKKDNRKENNRIITGKEKDEKTKE